MIADQERVTSLFHYLGDFLILGSQVSLESCRNLIILLALFDQLGVPMATNKLEDTTTLLTFLGMQIDTVSYGIVPSERKLLNLCKLVSEWLMRKTCTKMTFSPKLACYSTLAKWSN